MKIYYAENPSDSPCIIVHKMDGYWIVLQAVRDCTWFNHDDVDEIDDIQNMPTTPVLLSDMQKKNLLQTTFMFL